MYVGVCKIVLRLPEASSLKGKRHIVKKVVERVKNRFNVSIAEVGFNDSWQQAEIGFSAVGNEGSFINSVIDKALDFIEDMQVAEIVETDVEIIAI